MRHVPLDILVCLSQPVSSKFCFRKDTTSRAIETGKLNKCCGTEKKFVSLKFWVSGTVTGASTYTRPRATTHIVRERLEICEPPPNTLLPPSPAQPSPPPNNWIVEGMIFRPLLDELRWNEINFTWNYIISKETPQRTHRNRCKTRQSHIYLDSFPTSVSRLTV